MAKQLTGRHYTPADLVGAGIRTLIDKAAESQLEEGNILDGLFGKAIVWGWKIYAFSQCVEEVTVTCQARYQAAQRVTQAAVLPQPWPAVPPRAAPLSSTLPPGELRRYPLLQELLAQALETEEEANLLRLRNTLGRLHQAAISPPAPAPAARRQAEEANQQGLHAMTAADFPAAVQAFRAAAQANPVRVEVFNNLGYAYMKSGDLPAAERWLVYTLTRAPERTNAWANLGDTYAQQGHHQAALACFAHAYRFSKNRDNTRQFLSQRVEDPTLDYRVRQVAQQALTLPLLRGTSVP
jgi:tetratricopeptide (TPR) repeat protein